jgi:hypothetical protein
MAPPPVCNGPMSRRTAMLGSLVCLVIAATLFGAASASAAWHYTFRHFIFAKTAATSAGLTEAKRCARSPAGDWQFRSVIEVDFTSTNAPKQQSVELEIKAVMPITSTFRNVHDVDVNWTATLPKDPGQAALMTEHYEALAQSQSDFYDGMKVRWRPAKEQLEIRHQGLYYAGTEQLAPDEYTTDFKPKPGC